MPDMALPPSSVVDGQQRMPALHPPSAAAGGTGLARAPGLRYIARTRTLLGLGALLVAAELPPRAGAADLDEIVARKVLRVALPSGDLPPLVVTQGDGTVAGMEGDLIRDAARRLNVRLELIRKSRNSADLIAAVREGDADIALGQLNDSLEWAQVVRFTAPHLRLCEIRLVSRLAAVRAGGIGPLLADPKSQLAATEGSAVLGILREEFGTGRIRVVPTMAAAIDEVNAGRVVAASGDEIAVGAWLRDHPETGVRLEAQTMKEHVLGFAMALHWRAENLQAWLNLFVEKSANDETLRRLQAKYLGETRKR